MNRQSEVRITSHWLTPQLNLLDMKVGSRFDLIALVLSSGSLNEGVIQINRFKSGSTLVNLAFCDKHWRSNLYRAIARHRHHHKRSYTHGVFVVRFAIPMLTLRYWRITARDAESMTEWRRISLTSYLTTDNRIWQWICHHHWHYHLLNAKPLIEGLWPNTAMNQVVRNTMTS
jgi:hypothetical protein